MYSDYLMKLCLDKAISNLSFGSLADQRGGVGEKRMLACQWFCVLFCRVVTCNFPFSFSRNKFRCHDSNFLSSPVPLVNL